MTRRANPEKAVRPGRAVGTHHAPMRGERREASELTRAFGETIAPRTLAPQTHPRGHPHHPMRPHQRNRTPPPQTPTHNPPPTRRLGRRGRVHDSFFRRSASDTVRKCEGVAISDASVVHVSAASIWEASIKVALGRLEVRDVDLVEEIDASGFRELPIRASHASRAVGLPAHHNDPFDRILVAQAQAEGLTIVSTDAGIARYDVAILAF